MTDIFFFFKFGFTISPTPLLSHTQKPLPHQFHFSFHLSLTLEPTWHASAASACSVAPSLVGWLCLALLCGVKCVTGSQRGLHRPFTRQRFSRCALIYFYTHTHTQCKIKTQACGHLSLCRLCLHVHTKAGYWEKPG